MINANKLGRAAASLTVALAVLLVAACNETPLQTTDDATGIQFAKGGKKPPPGIPEGTPLNATFRDATTDRVSSDGLGTYQDDSDGTGDPDTSIFLAYGGIEMRLDWGSERRFQVGNFEDPGPFEAALTEHGCVEPCTGPGHIVGFINMRDHAGDALPGGFPDVPVPPGYATSEMHVRWKTATDEWVLRFGTDCDMNREGLDGNRVRIDALLDGGIVVGWAIESLYGAYLCKKPLKGRKILMSIDPGVAIPVGIEFVKQQP